jgi:hypothetical protein
MSLSVVLVGMIARGHGDVKFAHYALDLYMKNSNHIIRSFARFLRDLKKLHAYSLKLTFENLGSTPLYEAALDRKGKCLNSYLEPFNELVVMKKLPLPCGSNWTTMPNTTITYLCLQVGICWLRNAF